MSGGETRCPLTWPSGWRRIPALDRRPAVFKNARNQVSIAVAIDRVLHELYLLCKASGDDVLISTNVSTRRDGMPRSDRGEPHDPGAAVYWQAGKQRRCMAADRYDRVADNLAAIAATLEAMRAIERHGGAAILDRAFTGFAALPAPEQWFEVLGVSSNATHAEILRAHSRLAMLLHPDRPGGDDAQMARVNVARDEGLAQL